MKIFRSVFIYLFVACSFALSVYAGIQLWYKTTPLISGMGLLLAATPLWIYVLLKGAQPQKHDAAQAFGVSCICASGLAITMTSSWKYNEVAGITHLWAGACLLAWILYLKWYNGQSAALD